MVFDVLRITLYIAAIAIALLPCNVSMANEEAAPPSSAAELEEMLNSGNAEIRTILIHEPDDKNRLMDMNLLLMTIEEDYIVVLGDHTQLEKIEFPSREPRESDYKLRQMQIWIENTNQVAITQRIVTDLWPINEIPGIANIRALDYQIRWLLDLDYLVTSKK